MHLPHEPTLSTFGEIAYGNESGDQYGTVSLHATDSLITNVSL